MSVLVGIAGGVGKGAIFRKGKVVGTYPESELMDALLAEVDKILIEHGREPYSEKAPKLSEMKLINYDTIKYGSVAERTRLLKKWDAEVKSAPR